MGGIRLSFPACVIAGKDRIERHDVLILRKYALADGVRTYDDALLLLAVDEMCPEHCDDWRVYFVEQLAAFIVHVAPPRGRLDPLKSAWLMQALARDGIIENPLCLEVLLHAMECAGDCPGMLTSFALDQLRLALAEPPAGAQAAKRPSERAITARDMSYLWRILRRNVSEGRLQISPLEASILNAIDDLADHRRTHPRWSELIADLDDCGGPENRAPARAWLRMDADTPAGPVIESEIDVRGIEHMATSRTVETDGVPGHC
jgi:hypothetical protein